ncbi:alpha,alpha-trehalose-phosphate synthase (UDP-forming) [Amycolatopsis nalaikhensis]|uniref:Trehalose-6-phosphate synthase n=1 Tax=Amycolatopsis nalaikhensis TaxID=715472 RepID=A0ABY8XJ62_9PSEU|nr:trehalose-6-phosphate synthase [Amycolatopsis sp. 2-2]WIV55654.1 trehalose-6-phosphate synthase [Amycolatopsis sp. 2-2]
MALKREPTPAGAITELFDRLHDLHLDAGEPGVRQIATGIGRGVLSYTTVHNVFRGPKVPKWGHLELIVDQLGGNPEAFHVLWRAARLAELAIPGNQVAAASGPASVLSDDRPQEAVAAAPAAEVPGGRRFGFVLVTNRIPVHAHTTGNGVRSTCSAGLDQVFRDLVLQRQGVWVGWSRRDEEANGFEQTGGPPLMTVALTGREVEWHQEGQCSSTLWPLYHDAIERPEFRRAWRDAYRVVNERYADAVDRVAASGAAVWIHDYQLQLVPALVRERRPDLRIGFFLHIPLPPPELFTQLPGREEVLRGLLGADVVGFQRPRSVQNFVRLCADVLGLPVSDGSVDVGGRTVDVRAYPVSIDVGAIEGLVGQSRTRRRAQQIRAELGNPDVLVAGIDRLDYTKGIEQRLVAYGEILDGMRSVANPPVFVQVATLSRERVARYASLRERVDRLAGHLNGSYGRMGSPAVRYTNSALDFHEVAALYRAADVMVATPFRDGMNLVAKEYVASRLDDRGVLVLSEFAGSAAELPEAILVNPNDTDDLKDAILRAIAMRPAEQSRRMKAMRSRVRAHDSHAWITSVMADLDRAVRPV